MVKPEQSDDLHLVYHFTVLLSYIFHVINFPLSIKIMQNHLIIIIFPIKKKYIKKINIAKTGLKTYMFGS